MRSRVVVLVAFWCAPVAADEGLAAWMKANAAPAVLANDAPRVEAALAEIAGRAPATGYPNWKSIAEDGARAARAADLAAAKAACRSCHEQYRKRYRGGS